MRVLMMSKALIVGIYQRKLELLAERGIEVLAVVPPSWRDGQAETQLERAYTRGYRLEVLPLVRNGDFHLHFYRGLGRVMRQFRPDIVHIDEEPYNLAAWQAQWQADQVGARSVVFSWQNILRQYPPPFRWGEAWVLKRTAHLIVGTESAGEVWRAKGYHGPMSVIPQFGTDDSLFKLAAGHAAPSRPFTIGFFGRWVEEKGLDTLLHAASQLDGEWRLLLMGSGPQRSALETLAAALGIADRVEFAPQVPSLEVPKRYHALDVFVLPSRTRSHWKEQFGRVLVEAMMSGVPVIGSNSAAIPGVIGDAGVIFPEGDVMALAAALRHLRDDSDLRATLAARGRIHAQAHYTHTSIAESTYQVYQQILETTPH